AQAWGATEPLELRIAGDGTDDAALAAVVRGTLGDRPVAVLAGTEQAEAIAAELTGDSRLLTAVLLVFGTVALLVAGLVIANTFAVLLA
ncbi:hypothetical protein, partial [Acinetobacter baumannii]|uniref:hypothetical protein n=1 Tax=Acinetobacter baumannii TaxID=470 RepID=UPI0018E0829E